MPSRKKYFNVLIEHDPPGARLEPGQNPIPLRCWVKQIAAFDPEEACLKAARFVASGKTLQGVVENVRVITWREVGEVGGSEVGKTIFLGH